MSSTANQAARKIETYLFDEYPDNDQRRADAVKQIESIIADAYKPVMEVLREALRSPVHAAGCKKCGPARSDAACNCWVSRAQKIVGEG